MDLIKILQENITLEVLYYVFALFVSMDILTGVVKAWKNGRMKSRTLRDGLFGSIAEIILLFICMVVNYLIPIAGPVIFILFIWMNIKELTSICENLLEIGCNLPSWLVKGLKVYTDKLDGLERVMDESK
ncbi:holin [Clostridium perfringens]|nr:holin [Clostridium perfringens]